MQRVPLNTPLVDVAPHQQAVFMDFMDKENRKDQRPNYLNLHCFNMCVSARKYIPRLPFLLGVVLFFGGLHDKWVSEFKLVTIYVAGKDKGDKGRKREGLQH